MKKDNPETTEEIITLKVNKTLGMVMTFGYNKKHTYTYSQLVFERKFNVDVSGLSENKMYRLKEKNGRYVIIQAR